jgi:hypothetical protein
MKRVGASSGPRLIRVAPAATIVDDRGDPLWFEELAPGDAIAYHVTAAGASGLRVAREYWAVPGPAGVP